MKVAELSDGDISSFSGASKSVKASSFSDNLFG
jgi:hypothetical protein